MPALRRPENCARHAPRFPVAQLRDCLESEIGASAPSTLGPCPELALALPAPNPSARILTRPLLIAGLATSLATLCAGCLLAWTGLSERLGRNSDTYEALLNTFAQIHLQQVIHGAERELRAVRAVIDEPRMKAGENLRPQEWQIFKGFQQLDHYLFIYNARTERIDTFPRFVAPPSYRAQERPWFKVAVAHRGQSGWTEPYSEQVSAARVVTLAQALYDAAGDFIGVIAVDLPLNALETAATQAMGNSPALLRIEALGTREWIAGVRGSDSEKIKLQIAAGTEPGDTWGALRHGLLFRHVLATPGWEVQLFLPPEQVRSLLFAELRRQLLPLLAFLGVMLGVLFVLARTFRREQALLADALDSAQQGQAPDLARRPQKLWLMDEQLGATDRLANAIGQARELARRDALTGLPNRRSFEGDCKLRSEAGEAFGLAFIDIDHFKRINDDWGHGVGDTVLQRITQSIESADLPLTLYRLGGDEFAALIDEPERVREVCQALISIARHLAWRESALEVTLSIGAALSSEAQDLTALAQLADARLYSSKRRGRDCATCPPLARQAAETTD